MSIQHQDHQVLDWDRMRTIHVGITGFTLIGPISHLWYKWLEMAVIAFNTESVYVGILIRMVLDAMLFSPIAIGGYFTWRSILEGRNHNGVLENLEHKWFTSLQASWSFWPVANIMYVICPTNIFLREALLLLFAPSLFGCWNLNKLSHVTFLLCSESYCFSFPSFLLFHRMILPYRNFGFVPVPFRVLYNNCLSLFWNGYLSNMNQRQKLEQLDRSIVSIVDDNNWRNKTIKNTAPRG